MRFAYGKQDINTSIGTFLNCLLLRHLSLRECARNWAFRRKITIYNSTSWRLENPKHNICGYDCMLNWLQDLNNKLADSSWKYILLHSGINKLQVLLQVRNDLCKPCQLVCQKSPCHPKELLDTKFLPHWMWHSCW